MEQEWSKNPAVLVLTPPVSPSQGMVGKLLGWLDPGGAPSDTPPGVRRHVARLPSGGAPDFTAVTEDPDRRRHRQQQPSRQQPQREAAVHGAVLLGHRTIVLIRDTSAAPLLPATRDCDKLIGGRASQGAAHGHRA